VSAIPDRLPTAICKVCGKSFHQPGAPLKWYANAHGRATCPKCRRSEMPRMFKVRLALSFALVPLYLFFTGVAGMAHFIKLHNAAGTIHAMIGFSAYLIAFFAALTVRAHLVVLLMVLSTGLQAARVVLPMMRYKPAFIALLSLLLCSFLAHSFGYWVRTFGILFSGYEWVTVGIVLGLVIPREYLVSMISNA